MLNQQSQTSHPMQSESDNTGAVIKRKAPDIDKNVYASAWVLENGLNCAYAFKGATACSPQDDLAMAAFVNAAAFYTTAHDLAGYVPIIQCYSCTAAHAQADAAAQLALQIGYGLVVEPFVACAHGDASGCAMLALLIVPEAYGFKYAEYAFSGPVGYGVTDLGMKARDFRFSNSLLPNRNVAVFEYLVDGEPHYAIAANVPDAAHSEKVIAKFLQDARIPNASITRIYSERIPCGGCAPLVGRYPNAVLTYSFTGTLTQGEAFTQLTWIMTYLAPPA